MATKHGRSQLPCLDLLDLGSRQHSDLVVDIDTDRKTLKPGRKSACVSLEYCFKGNRIVTCPAFNWVDSSLETLLSLACFGHGCFPGKLRHGWVEHKFAGDTHSIGVQFEPVACACSRGTNLSL